MGELTPLIDVLIIGAGPSGCVSASFLALQGYQVEIIEKAVFPRFVIGESLLPSSMSNFEEASLLGPLKEANFEIKKGAIFLQDNKVCNIDFNDGFTKGWTWTWQVPREDFDKIVADQTEKNGVTINYNSEITELAEVTEGFEVTYIKNKKELKVKAKKIIDSSGNGKVIGGFKNIKSTTDKTNRNSFFTRVKDTKSGNEESPRQIYFDVLAKDLWFWVIPFSTNETSIGFVGDDSHFRSSGNLGQLTFEQMLEKSDRFKDRFKGQAYLFEPIVFNAYSHTIEKVHGENYVLTGNSTGFMDPVFSSGVAVATQSGLLAAKLMDKELKGEQVNWDQDYTAFMNKGLDVFRTYIKAWYDGKLQDIFFYEDFKKETKQQITSVLAGYVWDYSNPFVKNGERLLNTLDRVIQIEKREKSKE